MFSIAQPVALYATCVEFWSEQAGVHVRPINHSRMFPSAVLPTPSAENFRSTVGRCVSQSTTNRNGHVHAAEGMP